MRRGSIAAPLPERWAVLATSPFGWKVGWAVWMLAALAYVAFMERLTRGRPEMRLALVFGAMAAGVDLVGDTAQMILLPLAAASEPGPGPLFLLVERAANGAGLVVANGLYSLAVLVATRALPGHAAAALGSITFVLGAVLAVGGLTGSADLVVLAAGPTILAYCLWVAWIAREAGSEATDAAS